MNIYSGSGRRQVGTGIWSTITRGIRPIIMSLFHKLRPHAINVAKSAATSALRAGTHLATDAMVGNINKEQVKRVLKNEGSNFGSSLKRQLIDGLQSGSGHKRRRIQAPRKSTMKRKAYTKRKTCCKRKPMKRLKRKSVKRKPVKRKPVKRKTKNVNKRKSTKRKSTVSKQALRDIFN